ERDWKEINRCIVNFAGKIKCDPVSASQQGCMSHACSMDCGNIVCLWKDECWQVRCPGTLCKSCYGPSDGRCGRTYINPVYPSDPCATTIVICASNRGKCATQCLNLPPRLG